MGRSILFLILLFVFHLSACSHKSSAPVSADTMPDMEELLAYSQSHSQEEYEKKLKEIQAVIDNTSYEELCQILTDSLASWADTQTDYEITDTSIEFSEDPLLMDEQRKEKLYNNWTVSVNISWPEMRSPNMMFPMQPPSTARRQMRCGALPTGPISSIP